ncbi:class I SAM-dependent methyltransferase [Amycolatopsis australiensis]|uniref:S-adenosyl-L-methionine-dependent methyltransferase n=1 Tax=Amycolatopsis australiensis TaxID=546364 RepID=A0A1K1SFX7_9PSEU|nr:SAM-dependent methyltransferase [Amycolatopsis australiensis]SFW82975.1 methyltransferase, TIGR00027 family [Amycolatopsis australiensis]
MTTADFPGIAPRVSRTAFTAAAARAAHLLVDAEPSIFADTLAAPLLGPHAEELLAYHRLHGTHPVLAGARLQAVCRSRFTEDRLTRANSGIDQYVILGAGLDSFAYRAASRRIRVFEVDRPATQDAKRELLDRAGIAVPASVTFVPADFEAGPLRERLVQSGLDPFRRVFVSWLGVTMYLTRKAILATLTDLGAFAPGSEIVTDHLLPEELRDAAGNGYAEAVAPLAAQQGEPWHTFLSPAAMAGLLRAAGFEVVEQAGQRESVAPRLWNRTDALRPAALSALVHARVPAPGK